MVLHVNLDPPAIPPPRSHCSFLNASSKSVGKTEPNDDALFGPDPRRWTLVRSGARGLNATWPRHGSTWPTIVTIHHPHHTRIVRRVRRVMYVRHGFVDSHTFPTSTEKAESASHVVWCVKPHGRNIRSIRCLESRHLWVLSASPMVIHECVSLLLAAKPLPSD